MTISRLVFGRVVDGLTHDRSADPLCQAQILRRSFRWWKWKALKVAYSCLAYSNWPWINFCCVEHERSASFRATAKWANEHSTTGVLLKGAVVSQCVLLNFTWFCSWEKTCLAPLPIQDMGNLDTLKKNMQLIIEFIIIRSTGARTSTLLRDTAQHWKRRQLMLSQPSEVSNKVKPRTYVH